MNDPETDRAQAIALFRYGLIAELVHLPPGSKGLAKQLAERAARDYSIPGSTRTRVAAETLRDWLKAYRRGGFAALVPKPRADRGQARALPAAVVEALLSAKEANPKLSVQLVIREARQSPDVPAELPLPPSTVHRLLARQGLMAKAPEDPGERDRRRFAFAQAGELWMSDVMHGPSVGVGGRIRRKTYLLAFIDDATRVVPSAAFALSENTQTFLPVLQQAILRRGLPQRLYVDNGANYRSQHLALVCAKLSIALIHARPYQPQGKGKIERFFKTLRAQLLTRLAPEDTASLTALNRRLAAWIEGEYHMSPHRGLDGRTPLEQWAQSAFPFDVAPEPDALFASAALQEAEARLKHLLELRAIGLVTGEAGSGKTTVCRKVAAALHPGLYRVFYVPLSTGNVLSLEGDDWQATRDDQVPKPLNLFKARRSGVASCHILSYAPTQHSFQRW